MRTLPSTILAAIYAEDVGETFLYLLELRDSASNVLARLVNNSEDITSGGDLYSASAFEHVAPKNTAGEISNATILIENVSQQVAAFVRQQADPMIASLTMVAASDPDTPLTGPWVYTVRRVQYNAQVLRADLEFDGFLDEPFPVGSFTPNDFPGLFNAIEKIPE